MSFDENKSNKSNRRDFLKKAAAIGLGAAVGGAALRWPRQASAQIALPKAPMPRRSFGRSGIKVSTLSLGGMFDIAAIEQRPVVTATTIYWGFWYSIIFLKIIDIVT